MATAIAFDASSTGAAAPSAKRVFIHRLFTTIASRYDAFNRLVSLGLDQRWRQRTVELSGVAEGMRVLDVCAGTGDVSLLCAQRLGARGLVVGMDFTEAMLRGAARKSAARRVAVSWLRGDAQQLPFAPETFDRVTIGFSTRNLSDLRQGLTGLIQALKPGGQLAILETGRPSNPLLRAAYTGFLFTIAPLIGLLLTGRVWPFTYLARSVKRFLTPAEVVALLESCGTRVRYVPLSGGLASLYLATKE